MNDEVKTVIVLKVVSYSSAVNIKDFVELVEYQPHDPKIEFSLHGVAGEPVGTLREFRNEYGADTFIIDGKGYTTRVRWDGTIWNIVNAIVDNKKQQANGHKDVPLEIQEKQKQDLTEYGITLYDEGIATTRINDLIKGMAAIHEAICKLDYPNMKIFMSKPIEERLEEWAPTTSSRSIKRTLKEEQE